MAYRQRVESPSIDEKGDQMHLENAAPHGSLEKTAMDPVFAGGVGRMNAEDRAAALRLAQAADPGLPIASRRSFVFTMIVLVVCMCSGDNGQ